MLTVTGSRKDSISTILPTGKARVQFRVKNGGAIGNYTGLTFSFSEDNTTSSTSVSNNAFVNQGLYVLGNTYIGTSSYNSSALQVAGNNNIYSIYASNNNSNLNVYGIYSSAINTSSGSAYGLYSSVFSPSSSSNLWAGYFTGGKVQVNGGNLLITSYGKVGIGTTTPQNALDVYGSVYLPANNSYWIGSYSDSGNRLKLNHNGTNAYIDYLPNLYFRADGTTNALTLLQNGNVGIGTTEPQTKLTVNGEIQVGIDKPEIEGYGDRLSFLGKNYNTDLLWIARYNISPNASELRVNIGDDANDEDRFVIGNHLYSDNLWYPHLVVTNSGKVGINVNNPQYSLDVNGAIRAKEVKVETNWADFVFKDNYLLKPLQEVNDYIKANKRLPGIPSEQEVKETGVNLGDMQTKLLQKVEELTLYTIQQQEMIDKLNARIEKLENK